MIRSFSSSGQWRRRSTVEMISAAMSLAVHNHVDKDSMLHPIRPSSPSRYSRSREGSLTPRPLKNEFQQPANVSSMVGGSSPTPNLGGPYLSFAPASA